MKNQETASVPLTVVTYFLIVFAAVIIVCSYPFLKIPFDSLDHLMRIKSLIDYDSCTVFGTEMIRGRCTWHKGWAAVFETFSLNDPFQWAKVIHITQTLFLFFSLITASHLVLKTLTKNTSHLFSALAASALWIFGTGTYSTFYQQAWTMWYSVTYIGFATPLAIICFGLMVRIMSPELSTKVRTYIGITLAICAFLSVMVHPQEIFYLLIFACLLFMFNLKQTLLFIKKLHPLKQISLAGASAFFSFFLFSILKKYNYRLYLQARKDFFGTLKESYEHNAYLIDAVHTGRTDSTFSEPMLFSLILLLPMLILAYKKRTEVNFRVTLLLSVFYIAMIIPPFYTPVGAFFAVIMNAATNYRFFFMAPWVWIIPFTVFLIFPSVRKSSLRTIPVFVIILSALFLYSYAYNQTMLENIRSLYASLYKENVGIQYSAEEIERVKKLIEEHPPSGELPPMYYIRGDLAYIAYLIHGKSVWSYRLGLEPKSNWSRKKFSNKYELIEITEDNQIPMSDPVLQQLDMLRKP